MSKYNELAHRLFKRQADSYKHYFDNLRIDLKKANMAITIEEYLSTAMLSSVISFVFISLICLPVLSLLIKEINPIFLVPLSLVLGVSTGSAVFVAYLMYPTSQETRISKQIDMNLPFASIYMATVSGAGIPAHQMFKLLSQFKEYGVVSREAGTISTETELFGKDIQEAIKRAAERTPNEDFKEMLWGIHTIVSSGGSLRNFLSSTSKNLMRQYNMRIEQFGKKLSMFLELYLTLIFVGAIFFLILSTIFGAIGAATSTVLFMNKLIVYFALPVITIFFIAIIKNISPGG
ncbi:MAG: type II secretion system F family protein [archaeon]